MALSDRIKEARLKAGLTQQQLADAIGKAKSTINEYERGKKEPPAKIVSQIMAALEVEANFLYQDEMRDVKMNLDADEIVMVRQYRSLDARSRRIVDFVLKEESERPSSTASGMKRVYPYYRRIACAGTGFYFDDIPVETIEAEEHPDADFIIGVNGDSMEPTFSDGDDVYVRRVRELSEGDIGIFTIHNECFIKELGPDGLISHNPKYPMIRSTDDVWCVGKVLGKVEDC